MKESIINFHEATGAVRPAHDRFARPLRDLRISVMDRCNFRCPYCMPEDKYHKDFEFLNSRGRLLFGEIVRIARIFPKKYSGR